MKKKRKATLNDFRFYPIFQKRVELSVSSGVIEDYKNISFFPSSYKVISAMEASMNQARRIEAKIKVIGRYPAFSIEKQVLSDRGEVKQNGDRLFYTDTNEVLRISDITDPTNRKEYVNLLCSSGAYTTRATVQPNPQIQILKIAADSDQDFIDLFANHVGANEPENIQAYWELGDFDLFYKAQDIQYINQSGSAKNLYLLSHVDLSSLSSHFNDYLSIDTQLTKFKGALIKKNISSYLSE